jgi:hypothetical protein
MTVRRFLRWALPMMRRRSSNAERASRLVATGVRGFRLRRPSATPRSGSWKCGQRRWHVPVGYAQARCFDVLLADTKELDRGFAAFAREPYNSPLLLRVRNLVRKARHKALIRSHRTGPRSDRGVDRPPASPRPGSQSSTDRPQGLAQPSQRARSGIPATSGFRSARPSHLARKRVSARI